MIKRSKQKNWYFFAKGFIKIIDAIVPILSLGFFWTNLEYSFTKWAMFK